MDNSKPLSTEAQNLKLGRYMHFKKHEVIVLGVARHSENPKNELVVYTHEGKFWVRPLEMFLENVEKEGYKGPRFVFMGNE